MHFKISCFLYEILANFIFSGHSTQEGLPSSIALNPTYVPLCLQAFDLHVTIPGVRITSRENNSSFVCWRKSYLLSSLSRQVELVL